VRLPTVPHRVCRSEAEALEAYSALGGGRVVLKGCSAEVPHKSDHGLVVLAVNTEADVLLAYRRIARQSVALGVKSDGVLVARMVDGVRELALGARIDPVFGPAVMLGDGGARRDPRRRRRAVAAVTGRCPGRWPRCASRRFFGRAR
jgi:acyl-CoA synthetase (NDP forming)